MILEEGYERNRDQDHIEEKNKPRLYISGENRIDQLL